MGNSGSTLAAKNQNMVGGKMGWPEPSDSKNAVRRAGQAIAKKEFGVHDLNVLNRWRMAHGYLINTFQSNLRGRTKDTNIAVGQRLKRAATIVDKLQDGRAIDLATMHDIAGIRLTFQDKSQLESFRKDFHRSRSQHQLINHIDKYDYIKRPKHSGYRGIHDVYRYKVNSQNGVKWNGLLIEVQYRTALQHAWATAVEMADALTYGRTKFNQGNDAVIEFFRVCSELLARKHEGERSCLPEVSDQELVDTWHSLETRIRLFERLKGMSEQYSSQTLEGNVLLILPTNGALVVEQPKTYLSAVRRLLEIEEENPEWDVVLVSGDDYGVRSTYRNYFGNASEFIRMIEEATS